MEQFIHVMAWVGITCVCIVGLSLFLLGMLWCYNVLFKCLTPKWFYWCTVCIIHAKSNDNYPYSWGFRQLVYAMKSIKDSSPSLWQSIKAAVESDKVKEEDEL